MGPWGKYHYNAHTQILEGSSSHAFGKLSIGRHSTMGVGVRVGIFCCCCLISPYLAFPSRCPSTGLFPRSVCWRCPTRKSPLCSKSHSFCPCCILPPVTWDLCQCSDNEFLLENSPYRLLSTSSVFLPACHPFIQQMFLWLCAVC